MNGQEPHQLPAEITPNHLLQLATQQEKPDLEYLERLMAMQLQWEAAQAKKAYFAAFAAFKAKAPCLIKDGLVDFTARSGKTTRYAYDTLGQLTTLIGPALAEFGLSHSFDVDQKDDLISVTCILSHQDGHSETVSMAAHPGDKDGMTEVQQITSTITSLKRATLKAVTGLDPEEDETKTHTSGPGRGGNPATDVNQFDPGTLYEGMITHVEPKQTRNGNTYGAIQVQTEYGCVDMSFFSRPECIKDLEPKDWHTLSQQRCVFSFSEKERNGKVWRNLETLELRDPAEPPTNGESPDGDAPGPVMIPVPEKETRRGKVNDWEAWGKTLVSHIEKAESAEDLSHWIERNHEAYLEAPAKVKELIDAAEIRRGAVSSQ